MHPHPALVIAAVVAMLASGLATTAPATGLGTHGAPTPADLPAGAPSLLRANASAPGPRPYEAPGGSGPSEAGPPGIASVVAAEEALEIPPTEILPPHPSATPTELAAATASGAIRPLYTGTPAPMGLAYYGLSAGAGGAVVASVLNTTGLRGTVDLNASGVRAGDLYNNEGDGFGIQLNAVLTNVTLFGTPGYAFWAQDVVQYYPLGHFLTVVTNLWNFSSPSAVVTENAIYRHSAWGTDAAGTAGVYYAQYPLPFPVRYPFNLTLELSSSMSGGRDRVDLTVQLASGRYPAEDFSSANLTDGNGNSRPFDYVVFNSTAPHRPGVAGPAEFTADGRAYNAFGIPDDFELVFGGVDSGEQSTLLVADATLGLAYRAGSGFVAVPSAYSYGSETGETASGAHVAWSAATVGAPDGLAEYGTMTTGPSLLTGLWGTGVPQGSVPVRLELSPSNAFELFGPGSGWPAAFTVHEPALAPLAATETVYLSPGNYTLSSELSDFTPQTATLDVRAPMTEAVVLAPNASAGIYTPLWAFSNTELASLATAGNGTPADPYVVENAQPGPIAASFGLYNDYQFPVYPAVFLYGTTASTEFDDPPELAVATNTSAYPGPELPAVDYLSYWFWNVSHVAVLNAPRIQGWVAPSNGSYGFRVFVGTPFNDEAMVFFNSTHDLVANDSFYAGSSDDLLLYNGGAFFHAPFGGGSTGGGNNTVWGNWFRGTADIGLLEAESDDLVYNNRFGAEWTAETLPYDQYTADGETYGYLPGLSPDYDRFNVSRQPASAVHYAAGFPAVPLSGSVIGTAYQGGNAWWDYGVVYPAGEQAPSDPYGKLPYSDWGLIIHGGDFVPLTRVALYPVAVVGPSPMPSGVSLPVTVRATNGSLLDRWTDTGGNRTVDLPNGSYVLGLDVPAGWASTAAGETFTVNGSAASIVVSLVPAPGDEEVTFSESGLGPYVSWSVNVTGLPGSPGFVLESTGSGVPNATSLELSLPSGRYAATIFLTYACTYRASHDRRAIDVGDGPLVVPVRFHPVRSGCPRVVVREVGLPRGKAWSAFVSYAVLAQVHATRRAPTMRFAVDPGTVVVLVIGPPGYRPVEPVVVAFLEVGTLRLTFEFEPT